MEVTNFISIAFSVVGLIAMAILVFSTLVADYVEEDFGGLLLSSILALVIFLIFILPNFLMLLNFYSLLGFPAFEANQSWDTSKINWLGVYTFLPLGLMVGLLDKVFIRVSNIVLRRITVLISTLIILTTGYLLVISFEVQYHIRHIKFKYTALPFVLFFIGFFIRFLLINRNSEGVDKRQS